MAKDGSQMFEFLGTSLCQVYQIILFGSNKIKTIVPGQASLSFLLTMSKGKLLFLNNSLEILDNDTFGKKPQAPLFGATYVKQAQP